MWGSRAAAAPGGKFFLQSNRTWIRLRQSASRVVSCQFQRRHRSLAGAPTPCSEARIHARAADAAAARFARPQGVVLTPPSRVAGAAIGYGIGEAESGAGGVTPVPRTRIPWRKWTPVAVSLPPPGTTVNPSRKNSGPPALLRERRCIAVRGWVSRVRSPGTSIGLVRNVFDKAPKVK